MIVNWNQIPTLWKCVINRLPPWRGLNVFQRNEFTLAVAPKRGKWWSQPPGRTWIQVLSFVSRAVSLSSSQEAVLAASKYEGNEPAEVTASLSSGHHRALQIHQCRPNRKQTAELSPPFQFPVLCSETWTFLRNWGLQSWKFQSQSIFPFWRVETFCRQIGK